MSSSPRTITVVIGMHRSGTSLAAHLLSVLGCDMADEITPNAGNPRGHWERWELVEFHDRVLDLFGRGYFGASHAQPLPVGWWADPAVRCIRDEMAAWLEGRMGRTVRFGFKDPRTARLLPMWREVFADLDLTPHFVFCLRHPGAVADSLAARDDLPRDDGERRWLAYNVDAVNGIGGDPVAILPYERWFTDPRANLREIADLLGEIDVADLTRQRMLDSVVDKALCHHDAATAQAGTLTCWLYRQLLAAGPAGAFGSELRAVTAALDGFAEMMQPVEAERDVLRTTVTALTAELAEARGRMAALETAPPAEALPAATPDDAASIAT